MFLWRWRYCFDGKEKIENTLESILFRLIGTTFVFLPVPQGGHNFRHVPQASDFVRCEMGSLWFQGVKIHGRERSLGKSTLARETPRSWFYQSKETHSTSVPHLAE
jgi:hypothetical protein